MSNDSAQSNDSAEPEWVNYDPHSRALRKGRWSEEFACYSITKNQIDRKPVLARNAHADIIFECLDYLRQNGKIRLLAFCIMPDHLHLLFALFNKKTLSQVMKSFSAYTAKRINEQLGWSGQFWQEGFHDHRCRDDDDRDNHVDYIEQNPVRKELAKRAEDWPYSSANPKLRRLLDLDWFY